jgi:hypothetical protein
MVLVGGTKIQSFFAQWTQPGLDMMLRADQHVGILINCEESAVIGSDRSGDPTTRGDSEPQKDVLSIENSARHFRLD